MSGLAGTPPAGPTDRRTMGWEHCDSVSMTILPSDETDAAEPNPGEHTREGLASGEYGSNTSINGQKLIV
jgi:hypothetical protein